jgi:hypothetical protein
MYKYKSGDCPETSKSALNYHYSMHIRFSAQHKRSGMISYSGANRNTYKITGSDSNIYCYPISNGALLLQMTSNTSLQLEHITTFYSFSLKGEGWDEGGVKGSVQYFLFWVRVKTG